MSEIGPNKYAVDYTHSRLHEGDVVAYPIDIPGKVLGLDDGIVVEILAVNQIKVAHYGGALITLHSKTTIKIGK